MHRSSLLLACGWLSCVVAAGPEIAPSQNEGGEPVRLIDHGGTETPIEGPTASSLPPGPGTDLAPPSVLFRWPLRWQDFWHTVNYVDLDPTVGILDSGCHPARYDGYRGNEILI